MSRSMQVLMFGIGAYLLGIGLYSVGTGEEVAMYNPWLFMPIGTALVLAEIKPTFFAVVDFIIGSVSFIGSFSKKMLGKLIKRISSIKWRKNSK